MFNARRPWWSSLRLILVSSVLLVAACGEKPQQAGPGGGMKVPVSVVTVQTEPTELSVELPARVSAIRNAEIRARVTGIVEKIHFEQGSDVKNGQKLFSIDPAPYIAQRDLAAATLERAKADARSAKLLADRYTRLVKANAVSRQEYDNAMAAAQQTAAAVAEAEASLQAAEINLGYTEVTSPIDGRIGRSYITEGALVSGSQATLMADVQQLDTVYVDITRSTRQLAMLRKAVADGTLSGTQESGTPVNVLLEDGSRYDRQGRLLFSGVSVDPTTGQVSLRAEIDNPDHILLPGMYVRVSLPQGTDEKALLVPAQAVQRSTDGLNTLMLVKEGKVAPTAVELGPLVNGRYIVYSGLQPGDSVIVEGFQKIRPGAPVDPKPWNPNGEANGQPGQAQKPSAQG